MNIYKIRCLIGLLVDIAVVIWVDTGFKKAELFTWIIFEVIVMMIPINIMLILKRKKVNSNAKTSKELL